MRRRVRMQVPARRYPMRRVGTLRYARRVNFQLRDATPRWHGSAGTDQFVMTRSNPVRRDKSRPAIPPDALAGRGALYVKHSGGVLVSEEPDG